MNESLTSRNKIKNWVGQLSNPDGLVRLHARQALVAMGEEAVPELIGMVSAPNTWGRWEAVEALGQIGDPRAVDALVSALADEVMDVRGSAADSLIQLDRWAIEPLLQSLVSHFDSVWVREAAHHVLHVLQERGHLLQSERQVLRALEGPAPEIRAPWAAEAALEAMANARRQQEK